MMQQHEQPNEQQNKRQGQQRPKEMTGKKSRKKGFRALMLLCIPPFCVLFLLIGAMIGYSHFGGEPPWEVLHWKTWKHLIDLVFAD